jgi:tRNA(Ile)-lysidine synthase
VHPADEPPAAALADDELDALFAPLANASLIALAVSGGADSLALLDAVDRWRKHRQVVVLTIDHRLRRGSRAEADAVVAIAHKRGLGARSMTWTGPKPHGDVEAAARAARYRLLLAACREMRASHLVLAHHRDDLAETFLLRLNRGSGVFGLAAMRPRLDLGDIVIVRPFLSLSKARLTATVARAKLKPADDPMNSDPRFERARVRALMPVLAEAGLNPAALAATAIRLADAADAIDAAATMLLAEAVEADAFAVAWLDPERFAAWPAAVRKRALARILIAVGGDPYPPRHERLMALHDAIDARPGRFKRTLARAMVEARGGRFAFYREVGREPLPTMAVKPGSSGVWDHRFAFEASADSPAGLTIGPGPPGGAENPKREDGARSYSVGMRAALPVLRRRGRVLAAFPISPSFPPILAPPVTVRAILGERLRRPPLFPDETGR